ncbi:MAG: ribonuclease R [Bacteroidales bacterium]|jgi:ribonuclease R|nr:ribonuclease R [Bacteroidales bacterium]
MKEKNAKKTNTIETQILKILSFSPEKPMNYKQIAAQMGRNDRAMQITIKNNIESLLEKEILIEEDRGKYRIDTRFITTDLLPSNYVIGKVDMKQTGKAYVIVDNLSEDVYIAPNNTNHALNNDKVKVYLFPRRKNRKLEGQITDVLERSQTRFVGSMQIHQSYAFFIPDAASMPVDIFIAKEDINGAKENDKVIVEMTSWNERANNPFGRVVEILGTKGENNTEMLSILAEYGFPLSFSEKVEKEAQKISEKISKEEIEKRRDFRGITTITIDPYDAKDFDDALSFRVLDNGLYEIGVHIADVSHYIKKGSLLDEEAYKRATSVYLVDRTIPMLPEKLSNGVCSLGPNKDSLTFSVVFIIDEKAQIIDQFFGKGIIHSNRRFTYEEVQKTIEEKQGELSEVILPLHKIATILRKKRFVKGAINFESQEVKFHLDENAKPIGVYIKESKEANWLVEEFMLLANKKVAEKIGKEKNKKGGAKNFVYRIHDEPNPEKLSTFKTFVSKLGYDIKTESRGALVKSFNTLFEAISGKGEETMISSIAIRTMSKAYYSTNNIGHYGLSFNYYTHFTSPIRRYPDLMVHRLLEGYLIDKPSVDKEYLEGKCEYCSLMEKRAAEAERTSVKYKQAEFLSDKIGEVFLGAISGVSKWGLYVLIDQNKCEGLIPIRSLNDDFYYIDEDNYQVVGKNNNRTYRLGDPIKIRVEDVNLLKKQMTFSLVDDGEFLPEYRSFNPQKEEEKKQYTNNKKGGNKPKNTKKTKVDGEKRRNKSKKK